MFDLKSGANAVSKRYSKRAQRMRRGAREGLRRIAQMVDIEQAKNLRGGGNAAPGSYPVPIRTGNLFQSRFFHVRDERLAVVGNSAFYAPVIHSDRPFLDDAVGNVNAPLEMSRALNKTVYAV